MSEKVRRMQEYLASEYGITTFEELTDAVENDKGVMVGVFVNRAENGGKNIAI